MKLLSLTVTLLFIASFICGSDAAKRKKRGNKASESFDPRNMGDPQTDVPTFAPTVPVAPTLNTATREPTEPTITVQKTPGSTAAYEFTTPPVPTFAPTMNAQTQPPVDPNPTRTPTVSPTVTFPTIAPTMGPTSEPTTAPSVSPTPSPSASPSGHQGVWFDFSPSNPTISATTNTPHGSDETDCPNATETASTGSPTDEGENSTNTSTPTMTMVPISDADTTPPTQSPIASLLMPTFLPSAATDSPTAAPSGTDPPTMINAMHATTNSPTLPTARPTLGTPSPTAPPTAPPTTIPTVSTPPSTRLTAAPTESPTLPTPIPTVMPSQVPTITPTSWPNLSPVLIVNAATKGPSMMTNNSNTTLSPTTNTSLATNVTEPCTSHDGSFVVPFAPQENATTPIIRDILLFSYELETVPRTNLEQVLPSLEIAFMDSILHVVFPSVCGAPTTSTVTRFLQEHTVVGVTATPADEVNPKVECEPIVSEKNECVVVNGKLSVYSLDGETEAVMDDVSESLEESMNDGAFVDPDMGVVRTSYYKAGIEDDGINEVEDTDSSLMDQPDVVRPVADRGSMLGVGLSLSAAGVFLFLVGASVYKRKQRLTSSDSSTFKEGATMNGLSRFDITHDDPSAEGRDQIRDVEIMPLSPAARIVHPEHRYTSDATSLTFDR